MGKSDKNESSIDNEKEPRNELLNIISQSKLTPKEKEVLKLRLGLEDDQSLTAEEVALHLNRTTQTIKRLEANALKKIRPRNRDRLKDYLI